VRLAEKFLYHIWDAQHIQRNLKTVSGKPLTIQFHGRWNTSKGPDFKNAILRIGDTTAQGDVEIHFATYDWLNHHHHENANFNDVILHVVFAHQQKTPFTIKENGEKIEILELRDVLDDDIKKLLTIYDGKNFNETEHLCDFFSGLDATQTTKILAYYGQERFAKKMKRFASEMEFFSLNQLLYKGLLEAAGYSKNKFQMLRCAEEMPYELLKNWYHNGMKKDEMLSILHGASGLLQKMPASIPKDIIQKWQELYAKQNFFKKHLSIEWDFFRIRPQNHPAVRMVQMGTIIYNCLSTSLERRLFSLFSYPKNSFSLTQFKEHYYAFFHPSELELPSTYSLGKTRLDAILINIILPIMMLYAEQNQYDEMSRILKQIYENYSGLAGNSIVTHMETGMEDFQRKLTRRSALFQQGVLELYHAFCEYRMCEMCALMKNKLINDM
jgi:hypothetical protein